MQKRPAAVSRGRGAVVDRQADSGASTTPPTVKHPLTLALIEKNSRERVRVSLDSFKGHDLVDVRVCAQLSESSGVWSPTGKGVALNVRLLPELIAALEQARAEAERQGLLDG